MTSKHQTQQEITTQLADLTETMQREKILLTPEMKKYLNEELAKLTDKLAKQEPIYPKDLEFISKIKEYIKNERFLKKLKARFEKNKYLHEGVEWTRVEESLKENPEALLSIKKMEKAGHKPDVYFADDNGFDIGTCSKQSPEKQRNCTYDESVEMAKAMGIDHMTREQYMYILQWKGSFDTGSSWSWLKTSDDIRKFGAALAGDRNNVEVCVDQAVADAYGVNGSWRGSLRVLWKKS